eukprot:TRINITY_DN8323_c0_g1_i1.p1 TRINITY_DN8323_c0_g1~~TRINITY_DN8323_c0_g1_i1.p1  ORF type:complete len:261 (+),score=72.90 TRINITY_DN8323_c0_g1_i1:341-1123(+)
MSFIWERLKLGPEDWQKIYKSLFLLEIILKAGDPRCISSIRGNIYKIKSLQTFSLKLNSEKGSGIREKSKSICELIDNPEYLEEERAKTKEIRSKLSEASGGSKYGGISSSDYGHGFHSNYNYSKRSEDYGKKKERDAPKKPKETSHESDDDKNDYEKKRQRKKSDSAKRRERKPKKSEECKPVQTSPLFDLADFDQANPAAQDDDFGNFTGPSAPAPGWAQSTSIPWIQSVSTRTEPSGSISLGTSWEQPVQSKVCVCA